MKREWCLPSSLLCPLGLSKCLSAHQILFPTPGLGELDQGFSEVSFNMLRYIWIYYRMDVSRSDCAEKCRLEQKFWVPFSGRERCIEKLFTGGGAWRGNVRQMSSIQAQCQCLAEGQCTECWKRPHSSHSSITPMLPRISSLPSSLLLPPLCICCLFSSS